MDHGKRQKAKGKRQMAKLVGDWWSQQSVRSEVRSGQPREIWRYRDMEIWAQL